MSIMAINYLPVICLNTPPSFFGLSNRLVIILIECIDRSSLALRKGGYNVWGAKWIEHMNRAGIICLFTRSLFYLIFAGSGWHPESPPLPF